MERGDAAIQTTVGTIGFELYWNHAPKVIYEKKELLFWSDL